MAEEKDLLESVMVIEDWCEVFTAKAKIEDFD